MSVACTPPDLPQRLQLSVPEAALQLLEPDTVRAHALHPGVVYRYLWSPRGPWAVHAVQIRLAERCDVGLRVLRPEPREAGGAGRARVSEMASGEGVRVLAAVNADFFTPEGNPVGVEIVDDRVTSRAPRPTFAWRRGAEPWMGSASLEADGVRLGWLVTAADSWDGASPNPGTQAVGGFPDLIDAGRRVGDLEVEARPSFAAARHPRTAVAWDRDSGELWLVVVDGRRAPYSVGMTLPELARLFESLGAEEALNLDGGGSTTLVLPFGTANRPSDATGERPVVNALAAVRTPDSCRLRR
ncbi:MAG: phosphodiester glycosidase family protein [Longimicrobiales bacterium]|nr:phosphodiester glycosidase family protein [Longimicrobiales bacterium]